MSKIETINFHDSCVLRIEHHDQLERLEIGLRLSDNRFIDLTFRNVMGWDFSPFEKQNILFDAKSFDYHKVPNIYFDEFDTLASYKGIVGNQECRVLILDPSVGLGGFIICGEITANPVSL